MSKASWKLLMLLSVFAATCAAEAQLSPRWQVLYDSNQAGSDDHPAGIGVDNSGYSYVGLTSPGTLLKPNITLLKFNLGGSQVHTTQIDDGGANTQLTKMFVDSTTGDTYLTGVTDSSGKKEVITAKVDSNGALKWQQVYAGQSATQTIPCGIVRNSLGDILVAGTSTVSGASQPFVLKLNGLTGAPIWARHITTYSDFLESIAIDSSDRIDIIGNATVNDIQEDMVSQYAEDGTLNWTIYYISPFHLGDFDFALATAIDGTILVGGESQLPGLKYSLTTLKLSPAGQLIWAKRSATYTGGYVLSIAPMPDGGCCVVGLIPTQNAMQDGIAERYGPNGSTIWSIDYDGPDSGNDIFADVRIDSEGYLLVAGAEAGIGTMRDQLLLKLDPATGNQIWKQSTDDLNHGDELPPMVALNGKGDIFTACWLDTPGSDTIIARFQETPQTYGDHYDVFEGMTTLFGPDLGVLANDKYVTGAVAVLTQSTVKGTLTLHGDGGFTYKPDSGYFGGDFFSYKPLQEGVFGSVGTALITVHPQAPTSLTFNPAAVVGGDSTTGKVFINANGLPGGTVIDLHSNSSVIHVPTTVTVPQNFNSADFTATTSPVAATVVRTVTASRFGNSVVGSLTLTPPLVLQSLGISPSTVFGGSSTFGKVTMSTNALTNTTVTLSDNSSAISTPASVVVPAGSSTATFTIQTSVVGAAATRTVSATYKGVTKNAALTLLPGALESLTLNPTTVQGGHPSTGKVTLTASAPPGGVVVSLSDNSSALSEPASVTVPTGATSATFTVTTFAVGAPATRTVYATLNGVTKAASITLTP